MRANSAAGRGLGRPFMGRLFDENGEPLYACGAKEGDRRYRYFVSRKLIRRSDKTDDRGWRHPAEGTVHAVTAAALALSAERLKAQADLPIEWDAQERILSE